MTSSLAQKAPKDLKVPAEKQTMPTEKKAVPPEKKAEPIDKKADAPEKKAETTVRNQNRSRNSLLKNLLHQKSSSSMQVTAVTTTA